MYFGCFVIKVMIKIFNKVGLSWANFTTVNSYRLPFYMFYFICFFFALFDFGAINFLVYSN